VIQALSSRMIFTVKFFVDNILQDILAAKPACDPFRELLNCNQKVRGNRWRRIHFSVAFSASRVMRINIRLCREERAALNACSPISYSHLPW
jgi:hypothetical protein